MPGCRRQAHIECVLTIEEETPDTCRQTLDANVEIHIPGLGRIAESIIADSLKKVYLGIPAIVERCACLTTQSAASKSRHTCALSAFAHAARAIVKWSACLTPQSAASEWRLHARASNAFEYAACVSAVFPWQRVLRCYAYHAEWLLSTVRCQGLSTVTSTSSTITT